MQQREILVAKPHVGESWSDTGTEPYIGELLRPGNGFAYRVWAVAHNTHGGITVCVTKVTG